MSGGRSIRCSIAAIVAAAASCGSGEIISPPDSRDDETICFPAGSSCALESDAWTWTPAAMPLYSATRVITGGDGVFCGEVDGGVVCEDGAELLVGFDEPLFACSTRDSRGQLSLVLANGMSQVFAQSGRDELVREACIRRVIGCGFGDGGSWTIVRDCEGDADKLLVLRRHEDALLASPLETLPSTELHAAMIDSKIHLLGQELGELILVEEGAGERARFRIEENLLSAWILPSRDGAVRVGVVERQSGGDVVSIWENSGVWRKLIVFRTRLAPDLPVGDVIPTPIRIVGGISATVDRLWDAHVMFGSVGYNVRELTYVRLGSGFSSGSRSGVDGSWRASTVSALGARPDGVLRALVNGQELSIDEVAPRLLSAPGCGPICSATGLH